MFSLKKIDDLRAREQKQEEKGTTDFTPKPYLVVRTKKLVKTNTVEW